VKVVDGTHPATKHLEKSFDFADDISQFKYSDRNKVQVLLSLDPEGVDLKNPKVNLRDMIFPVSWARSHGQGRVFYTALGDWEQTWKDQRYQTHLINGIRWTMRLEEGD
jgi:type 1 glutamine amidotransferase